MSERRSPGFYWVKYHLGKWEVAEWMGDDVWFVTGSERTRSDTSFALINETPLTEPANGTRTS